MVSHFQTLQWNVKPDTQPVALNKSLPHAVSQVMTSAWNSLLQFYIQESTQTERKKSSATKWTSCCFVFKFILGVGLSEGLNLLLEANL